MKALKNKTKKSLPRKEFFELNQPP